MRENVLALEVVLADGRIIQTGTRAAKSSAGYDLTGLFVGAEGTLGVITRLTLRLHGQPEEVAAAVCGFDSLEAAVECVTATIQSGIPMARIEFVDAATARAFNLHSGASLPETPHLMVEFHGSPGAVREDAARFGEIATEFGATGFDWAASPEDRARLWRMRHGAYHAAFALRPGAAGVVTDVCVPMSELPGAVAAAARDIAEAGMIGPIVGHVGDGNFHSLLLVDPASAAELATAKTIARRMAERALEVGGTISGEHGIGTGKNRPDGGPARRGLGRHGRDQGGARSLRHPEPGKAGAGPELRLPRCAFAWQPTSCEEDAMSHNHEPDKAARRHKPAIIAIAIALLAALLAFWVFRPGVPEEGGDGLANTPPPASMPLGDAEGRSDETAPPVTPGANTPADAGVPCRDGRSALGCDGSG